MNWSLKKLHKLILLSRAYQQGSDDVQEARKTDSENRLVWRMNRRRLDFEAMRDTLLTAGGELDATIGGRSVDITRPPFSRRRAVYAMVDRSNLPSLYRVFDFANPDAHTAERFVTTSPQQSLFMMNSPFVVEQTRRLANRPEMSGKADDSTRIKALYHTLFNRAPTDREISIGQKFLQAAIKREAENRARKPSPWSYGFGEVDEAAKRVKRFTPLPYFTGDTWQVGMFNPDPDLGGLSLDAGGGTPGSDREHVVIRRWTAPKDGVVSVEGTIRHLSINGDGVRVRIISSRSGEVGSLKVYYSSKELNAEKIVVKKDDTLDFVADCGNDDVEDRFLWSLTLKMTSGAAVSKTSRFREAAIQWNAQDGFGGPSEEEIRPLTPWEKYAQALLLSNEFAFVD